MRRNCSILRVSPLGEPTPARHWWFRQRRRGERPSPGQPPTTGAVWARPPAGSSTWPSSWYSPPPPSLSSTLPGNADRYSSKLSHTFWIFRVISGFYEAIFIRSSLECLKKSKEYFHPLTYMSLNAVIIFLQVWSLKVFTSQRNTCLDCEFLFKYFDISLCGKNIPSSIYENILRSLHRQDPTADDGPLPLHREPNQVG